MKACVNQPVVTAVSTSEASTSRLRPALSLLRSNSPSHQETIIAATPLPVILVNARHSLMNLSMPRTRAMPGSNSGRTAASVAARVMKPAPVMPLAPLDEIIATSRIPNCSLKDKSMPKACAMNRVARVI